MRKMGAQMGIAPSRDSEGYVQTKERSEVGEPHCALGPISFTRLVETAAQPGKDLHRYRFTDRKQ